MESSSVPSFEAQPQWLLSLMRVGQAMAGERDVDKLIRLIRQETQQALNAERCSLLLYDPDTEELWSKEVTGSEASVLRFPANMGIAGYVLKTGELLNIKNAYDDPRFNSELDQKTGYRTRNLVCIPIHNRKREIIGVFEVINKRDGYFGEYDIHLLKAITASAGAALENAVLVRDQKTAFESFIKTLSSTIDARDPITSGHSERVSAYSCLLGQELQVGRDDLEALNYAALLHDIGKIGIKEDILMKDGRLTELEYRHIQEHARYTYDILKNIYFERHLRHVPEIAASHHEKIDGSGYFRGLKGTEIPFSGRIIALSDVFDAITSRRHYRNRMPFDRVLSILRRDTGTHFDIDCSEAFFGLRLYKLAEILLIERGKDMPVEELKSNFLPRIDRGVTLGQYEGILKKVTVSDGLSDFEAETHRIFSRLYHQGQLSELD